MRRLSAPFKSFLGLPADVDCYMSVEDSWWIVTEKNVRDIQKALGISGGNDDDIDIYAQRRFIHDSSALGEIIGVPDNDVEVSDIASTMCHGYRVYIDVAPMLFAKG
jgi:hypothetical protein